jgi:hypothetical protein
VTNERASYSLFAEPWWLDAVAPGAWEDVRVEQSGSLIARLPFVRTRRMGIVTLGGAPLTKQLGPWVRSSEAKYTNALSAEHEAMGELIGQLPVHDRFRQGFAPEVTNWLPFAWAGFDASVAYTYRLTDLSDLDAVWSGLRENIRREIRKAERQVEVVDGLGLDRFLDTAAQTFERQGLKSELPTDVFQRIEDAASSRDARQILFAVDDARRVHAALYLVWDDRVAYYLAGGGDPDLRKSGAMSLLMWRAIQQAASVSAVFDFEGSMLPPVERFFRAFGARQTQFLVAERLGRRSRLLRGARYLLDSIKPSPSERADTT